MAVIRSLFVEQPYPPKLLGKLFQRLQSSRRSEFFFNSFTDDFKRSRTIQLPGNKVLSFTEAKESSRLRIFDDETNLSPNILIAYNQVVSKLDVYCRHSVRVRTKDKSQPATQWPSPLHGHFRLQALVTF